VQYGSVVIRPADANELLKLGKLLSHTKKVLLLCITRQKVPVLDRLKFASAENFLRLTPCSIRKNPQVILMASGSEWPLG